MTNKGSSVFLQLTVSSGFGAVICVSQFDPLPLETTPRAPSSPKS